MLELFILLFICVAVGRRIVQLLPRVMKRTIGFYLAPILGLAALVIMATAYGWVLPFQFRYSLPLAMGLTGLAVGFEKYKQQLLRDWLQLCLFAGIASLPILAPIIRFGGYNPFTDIFTYLVHGQWLQTHAFSEKAIGSGFYPALSQLIVYQGPGSRMGGSFLLGYVQSLFRLEWSYYAYIPTVSLAFVTGCIALGAAIRQVIPERKTVILALSAMPCFLMNGFIYGAEWGFFPQTFGLAFAAGMSALIPFLLREVIKHDYSWSQIAVYTLPVSVCTSALLFAYNEPFLIFGAAIGLFFSIVAVVYRKKIKIVIGFFGLFALETIILINYEGVRIARNLIQTLSITDGQSAIGWPVLWRPIQFLAYAFGLKSPLNSNVHHIDYWISSIIFPMFFLAMCLYLFWSIGKKKTFNMSLLFLLCVDLVLLLVFLKFRYLSPNMSNVEVGHTFLQFKIAKYASLFSIGLAGVFLASLWHDHQRFRVIFSSLYLAGMTWGLLFHTFNVTNAFHHNFPEEVQRDKRPFDALLQLRAALATIPEDEVVHVALGTLHSKLRQMVAYILYDRKISSDYRDDGYILGSLPLDERNMSSDGARYMVVMKSKHDSSGRPESGAGNPFEILKAPFNYITLEKREDGFAMESNAKGDTWNWVNNTINFYFSAIGKPQKVKFKFNLMSYSHPRSYQIQVKNSAGFLLANYAIPSQTGEKVFESPWIDTDSAQLVLHVEADGEAVRLSRSDSREAKFMIANVSVAVS